MSCLSSFAHAISSTGNVLVLQDFLDFTCHDVFLLLASNRVQHPCSCAWLLHRLPGRGHILFTLNSPSLLECLAHTGTG